MKNPRHNAMICIFVCLGISMLWGTSMARDKNAWVDFRAVYAGTRCLLHGHNPYNVSDLEREYRSEDGQRPPNELSYIQAVTLYVNIPTTFIFTAPFAALSWGPAHTLWMMLTTGVFITAIFLMWSLGARHSLTVSTALACILAANCETIFVGGNTAGIVVGLCVVAVWCFVQDRFVWVGVICFAFSLAIKPHDSGFLWLYFLLAGGIYRKRALQSLMMTAVMGVAAAAWLWRVAPSWMHDWNVNLAAIAVRGGINEPGPNSLTGRSPSMVVDLQAALSIFRDDPRFYNTTAYIVCGALLLVWLGWTLRSRFSVPEAWYGLASVAALTILVTYHRPWDAKIVMIAIPPCCILWSKGGTLAKIALTVTAAAVFFTGDVSLAILNLIFQGAHPDTSTILGKMLTLVLIRPASLALFAAGVFYLWIYLRSADEQKNGSVKAEGLMKATSVTS